MNTTSSEKTISFQELSARTTQFARNVQIFCRRIPRDFIALYDAKQFMRDANSIAPAYIDADTAKDRDEFLRAIGNCRRLVRRSQHWLTLLDGKLEERLGEMRQQLHQETDELEKIFGAIIGKMVSKAKKKVPNS